MRVWIQGGLHGNEPASTEGVLFLIDQLLNNPEHAALLDAFDYGIVPMANIDGYEKQDRYAADGMDLNRDQTKLMEPESQYLKKAFSDFNADIALDFHEYRPYRRDYAQLGDWGVTGAFDVMFLYSGNLNVPESLRNYTREHFVAAAEKRMDELGFSHHNYFSSDEYYNEIQLNEGSTNARSSATSYALSNCISTLVEVRGVGLGRTSFKRRTYITFNVAMSYLNYAYQNQNEVRAELMKSRTYARSQVVITSDKTIDGVVMTFIDNNTQQLTQIELVVNDAWRSVPDLTRKCPAAYIILPGNDEVVKRLEILGIVFERLANAQTVQVENYTVTDYFRDVEKYEGVHRQKVKTELALQQKTIPAGSTIVYMDQPRAGLAAEVLEPEAINSFVSFNVIATALGDELPVYRYLMNKKL